MSGKVLAVVFAAMDLEGLDTFINDINLPPGSVLATADARGTIISRRPDPERFFGTKLTPVMREAMTTAGQRAVIDDGAGDGLSLVGAENGGLFLVDDEAGVGDDLADEAEEHASGAAWRTIDEHCSAAADQVLSVGSVGRSIESKRVVAHPGRKLWSSRTAI